MLVTGLVNGKKVDAGHACGLHMVHLHPVSKFHINLETLCVAPENNAQPGGIAAQFPHSVPHLAPGVLRKTYISACQFFPSCPVDPGSFKNGIDLSKTILCLWLLRQESDCLFETDVFGGSAGHYPEVSRLDCPSEIPVENFEGVLADAKVDSAALSWSKMHPFKSDQAFFIGCDTAQHIPDVELDNLVALPVSRVGHCQ